MKAKLEKRNSSISQRPPSKENLGKNLKKQKNPEVKNVKINRKMSNILAKRLSQAMDGNDIIDFKDDRQPLNPDEELPPRFLFPNDPNAPKCVINQNYHTRRLERSEQISQLAIHFSMDSCMIVKDSDEFKTQETIQSERLKNIREVGRVHEINNMRSFSTLPENDESIKIARKILRNKFNHSEIATQSWSRVIREKGVSTSKPNLLNFSGEVNQAEIYQAYIQYTKQQIPDRLSELKIGSDSNGASKGKTGHSSNKQSFHSSSSQNGGFYTPTFKRCLKIMERMIIQNNNESNFNDYKYMFTPSTYARKIELQGRDITGENKKSQAIFPLWRFVNEGNKGGNVTCVRWNPRYPDLFAVAYGSYLFGKRPQSPGICLFSIKNPSFPEAVIPCEECVMSLDFHPNCPSLLAAGLSNGSVVVFDIKSKNKTPLYKSSLRTRKHTDIVWEVRWSPETVKQNFFSISSDGKIFNWTLTKEKLECEEVFKLRYIERKNKHKEQEETSLNALASGLCFDFSPFDKFLFLVGTEEGNIHSCSRAYSGEYQFTYEGHNLAVYRVRFSPFNPDVFLSGSADWSVKIWNTNNKQAIMTFDMSEAVVDVTWSPFSSSVFVALTLEKCHFFDLDVNRYGEVDSIKPVDRKCTNLAFNWKEPILLVGDSHEGVSCFKLAPNLANPNVDVKSEDFRGKQREHLKRCMVLGSMID